MFPPLSTCHHGGTGHAPWATPTHQATYACSAPNPVPWQQFPRQSDLKFHAIHRTPVEFIVVRHPCPSRHRTPRVNNPQIAPSFHSVLSAFSPRSKLRRELSSSEQVDILIGTDCISEGQNLQDYDCVINYDVQWNPVTLIQRFGCIDRIGFTNNRLNKRDHYLEAMAKVFHLDHPKLFMGAPRLFNTKLWFHGPTILALFRALAELQSLKTKKNRTRSFADKATLNSAIKTAIERIKTDFLPPTELDSCETVKP